VCGGRRGEGREDYMTVVFSKAVFRSIRAPTLDAGYNWRFCTESSSLKKPSDS